MGAGVHGLIQLNPRRNWAEPAGLLQPQRRFGQQRLYATRPCSTTCPACALWGFQFDFEIIKCSGRIGLGLQADQARPWKRGVFLLDEDPAIEGDFDLVADLRHLDRVSSSGISGDIDAGDLRPLGGLHEVQAKVMLQWIPACEAV